MRRQQRLEGILGDDDEDEDEDSDGDDGHMEVFYVR